MPIWVKWVVTPIIVITVVEIARRSDRLGALIGALPLMTILAMTWMYLEGFESQKIALHAKYTFWYVIPTLPMLVIPVLLERGWPYFGVLATYCLGTWLLFYLTAKIASIFDIQLI